MMRLNSCVSRQVLSVLPNESKRRFLSGASAGLKIEAEYEKLEGPANQRYAEHLACFACLLSLSENMPKVPTKTARLRPTNEVSVMAWIEDSDQKTFLVRQAAGLKLWTLPARKVKRGESLVKALKRGV